MTVDCPVMKRERAERVADVLIATAVVSAAWVILRDPRGRRLAAGLLRRFLTSDAPRFLAREVRDAWEATA
jgi:hypothetical protein